jgi:hypothetical protein
VEISDPLCRELESRAIGAGEAICGRDQVALRDLKRLTVARRAAIESFAERPQRVVALGGNARADLSHVGAFLRELGEVQAPARKRRVEP